MNRVVHFEIHADNPARAQAFYETVFGWQFQQFGDEYWLITTGPDDQPGINGGMLQRRSAITGSDVIAYVCSIDVESLDDTLATIKQNGGEQVVDAVDIPNVGTYAYCRDPELNVFGVMQPVA
jgi:predicted enzyme related to lactoylglutathione lyase